MVCMKNERQYGPFCGIVDCFGGGKYPRHYIQVCTWAFPISYLSFIASDQRALSYQAEITSMYCSILYNIRLTNVFLQIV